MRAWRLCRAAHVTDGLNGNGGFHAPGRWHYQGHRVVYASATLSLAALESLVRVGRGLTPPDLAAVEIDIPDSIEIERIAPTTLPAGWDAFPAPAFTRQRGTDWIAAKRTAILEVPSAIIHHERNYLLNPAHSRFGRVRVVSHAPFSFDARLMA